jgi:hypothetical protein
MAVPAGPQGLDPRQGVRPRGPGLIGRGHGHDGTVGTGRRGAGGTVRDGTIGRIGIREYRPVTIGAG